LYLGGASHCLVGLTTLWLIWFSLTDSSAKAVVDNKIKAGIKRANIAPDSCDSFMVIHRKLLFASLISSCCWLIINFYRVRMILKA
jgi:hypothetical protein